MKIFNGIINISNKPYEMSILIDYDKETYHTDMFIKIHHDHIIKHNIKVDKSIIKINNVLYSTDIIEKNNEIFIIGKEEPGLLYYLTCCLMSRNFFIISNKEIV